MIRLKSILHPSDFSENSQHALMYACAFASHFGAQLHIVHALADRGITISAPLAAGYLPQYYYDEMKKSSNEALAKLPGEGELDSSDVVRETLDGNAFVEIIRYAKEKDIDLIVMGTHGRTGIAHLIMGSVAENVVRKAPCPVLTVHPEDHSFVMP